MSLFTGETMEVEFSAGVWTDVTEHVKFPVAIEQGRPTPFEESSAGRIEFDLKNPTGDFMPYNSGSAYYPNVVKDKRVRWKVTKSSVTYTRFSGWIQAWDPDFPTKDLAGAKVRVTAVDSLGRAAQRKLRSNLTEIALMQAASDGVAVDAWEAVGQTTGMIAYLTNYSTDTAKAGPSALYSGALPSLTFGADNDSSFGDVATCQGDVSCSTVAGMQASHLQMILHLKCPAQALAAGTWYFATYDDLGGGTYYANLTIVASGSNNLLQLRNGSGSSLLGTIATLPLGQWVRITATSRTDNAARSDWTCVQQDGTTATLSNIAVDIRAVRNIEYPAATGSYPAVSVGGIIGLGSRTALDYRDSFVGAAASRTLATRLAKVGSVLSALGVTLATIGSATTGVVSTGSWSGRYADVVLRELMRSHSGLVWARPRDSQLCAIASDATYPATPIATIDPGLDCSGVPGLTDSSTTRPTRVDVEWPGGVATAVDTTAEADGEIRSVRISSVSSTFTTAKAVGTALLTRSATGLQIRSLTVDLVTTVTDHTAALFSESADLSGLFPSARLRVVLPLSHFGVRCRDYHVEGWREVYTDPGSATVELELSPAVTTTVATEAWTGSDGAAWAAQWVTGATATGGSATIQTNRGRLSSGTVASAVTSRRLNITARADVEVTCTVTLVDSQATARLLWRADTTLATTGYYLRLDTSGTLALVEISAGVHTVISTWSQALTAGTAYGIRVRSVGPYHLARVWAAASTEPGTWNLDVEDTTHTASGSAGLAVVGDATTTARRADWDTLTLTDGA